MSCKSISSIFRCTDRSSKSTGAKVKKTFFFCNRWCHTKLHLLLYEIHLSMVDAAKLFAGDLGFSKIYKFVLASYVIKCHKM